VKSRYNANHAWPVCKFMHIGEACLWSFFFAAAVEQEYDSGRKLFRLSEEQFPPVETQHPLRRDPIRKSNLVPCTECMNLSKGGSQ
jgi:hypothetical protein